MNKPRGRPPKDASQRKDVDLRVSLTAAQKARIQEAATLDSQDMAEWARNILVRSAEHRIAKG